MAPIYGPCFVYFVLDVTSGLIKIGRCHGDVYARIRAGQSFNPNPLELLGVIPCLPDTEWDLHQKFAGDCVFREWFRDSPGLRSIIKRATVPVPPVLRSRCAVCHRQAVKGTKGCRTHSLTAPAVVSNPVS